jgi:hypothetical protein
MGGGQVITFDVNRGWKGSLTKRVCRFVVLCGRQSRFNSPLAGTTWSLVTPERPRSDHYSRCLPQSHQPSLSGNAERERASWRMPRLILQTLGPEEHHSRSAARSPKTTGHRGRKSAVLLAELRLGISRNARSSLDYAAVVGRRAHHQLFKALLRRPSPRFSCHTHARWRAHWGHHPRRLPCR